MYEVIKTIETQAIGSQPILKRYNPKREATEMAIHATVRARELEAHPRRGEAGWYVILEVNCPHVSRVLEGPYDNQYRAEAAASRCADAEGAEYVEVR